MSDAAPTHEVVGTTVPEDLEITCCLDAIGTEDWECTLVAMRAETAPGPAQTLEKVIRICHDQAETPVTISHQSLRDQMPGETRSSQSQRVMAAFRFLTPLGGVDRHDSKETGIEHEIDLPLLAAGCRAAQLAHKGAKEGEAAGGPKKRVKSERMPVQLGNVVVDALSQDSFTDLLEGNVADEDFLEAAESLLQGTIARTGSKVTSYTAAQRAIKTAINTSGYGRDNKAARRVALLSEAMRPLAVQKGTPKPE
jgi:hypothetical protein